MTAATNESLLEQEPLKPQDLVITMLGTYVRGVHETVWSGGLVTLLEEMGFSTAAARVALMRVVHRDLLVRVRSGRLVHYKLTERSERLLAEGDRRIFSLGSESKGAGHWTVLWHDLPEDRRLERGRLARRLRFLGFGSLQDALWVSPLNLEEEVGRVLRELNIAEHAGAFAGSPAPSLALDAILRNAWDLPALTARYRAFTEEFGPAIDRQVDDGEAFRLRTRLMHLYRGFAVLDPGLPDTALDDPQARPNAVETFDTLYEQLAPEAQRHFDAAALGPEAALAGEHPG